VNSNLEDAAKKFLELATRLRRLGPGTKAPKNIPVSPAHLAFLEYIATNKGCGIQEMAEGLKLAKPTVSIGVSQLEKNGLVVRKPDPTDGRAVRLFLTQNGVKIFQQAHAFHRQKFEQLLKGLSPEERDTLLALLERAIETAENNNQGDKI